MCIRDSSWEEDDYSLYGRFDFAFVNGVPKLLEFNADTPTSLVEAAVIPVSYTHLKINYCFYFSKIRGVFSVKLTAA